jgi:hypothetical protein
VGPDWLVCGVAMSLICCCRNTFTTDTLHKRGGAGGAAQSTPDLTLLQLNIKETVLCIQGASCQSQKASNAGRKPPVYIDEKIQHILASTMPLIFEVFIKIKSQCGRF